jgi:outer membrane protein assembly factor BamB
MIKLFPFIVIYFLCHLVLCAQNVDKPIVGEKEVVVEKTVPSIERGEKKCAFTWLNAALEKCQLLPEAYPMLDNLIGTLLLNQELKVEIRGYTDDVGAESFNRTLSRKRADEVKKYIVSKGVSPNRLSALGYGESNPVANNNNSEGRALNNRIEIYFISELGDTYPKEIPQSNAVGFISKKNAEPVIIPNVKLEFDPNASIDAMPEEKSEFEKANQKINSNKAIPAGIIEQNIYNSSDVKLKAPLKQSWSYHTNDIILNQQIADNVCYINTIKGITAISLNDAKELWSYSYPKSPAIPSVVTFSGNYAAFLSYGYLPDEEKGKSKLYLIDLINGKERWEIASEDIWYKPTIFLNDEQVFVVGGEPDEWKELNEYYKMEHDQAYLYCYSINDGKEVWKSELDDSKTELLTLSKEKAFLTYDYGTDDEIPFNKLLCLELSKGEKIWDYDPSGFITKSSVADVIFYDNKLFTRPLKNYPGVITSINPSEGEEIWSKNNGADKLFFYKDKVYAFSANAEWELGSTSSWYCSNITTGDKVFYKELNQSTKYDKMLTTAISQIGVVAVVAVSLSNVIRIASIFFPTDHSIPTIIPTSTLFNGLFNSSVLNDKGLFGIYRDGDSYVFSIINDNPDDDKKVEHEFPEDITDVSIANGTSQTHAFITYQGKIVLININTGKEEWSKEFSPGATSLGLIIVGDKLYLFTTQEVIQLTGG